MDLLTLLSREARRDNLGYLVANGVLLIISSAALVAVHGWEPVGN